MLQSMLPIGGSGGSKSKYPPLISASIVIEGTRISNKVIFDVSEFKQAKIKIGGSGYYGHFLLCLNDGSWDGTKVGQEITIDLTEVNTLGIGAYFFSGEGTSMHSPIELFEFS